MKVAAFDVDVSSYIRHELHRGERDWSETNCYADVLIELLHAMDREPLAGLGFCVSSDWEANQWTFFKFPHHEVRHLYGLSIGEVNPWKSVLDQTVSDLAAGQPLLIEVDSWYLPDTAGSAYQTSHTKTTIGAIEIDVDEKRLVYAHNQSVHELFSLDFDHVFRTDGEFYEGHLPPYVESVKVRGPGLQGRELSGAAVQLLRQHIDDAPVTNPFVRFAARLPLDLANHCAGNVELFHAYGFATFRQFGACYSLAGSHLEWLVEQGEFTADRDAAQVSIAIDACRTISTTAKSLQMRAARAALAGKSFSADEQLERLIMSWDTALGALRALG